MFHHDQDDDDDEENTGKMDAMGFLAGLAASPVGDKTSGDSNKTYMGGGMDITCAASKTVGDGMDITCASNKTMGDGMDMTLMGGRMDTTISSNTKIGLMGGRTDETMSSNMMGMEGA